MTSITLAKALKHKKRVIGRINRVTASINAGNSFLSDNTPRHDVLELVKTRQLLVDHLIAVKVAINTANAKIVKDIYRLAELRGEVSFWESLNTTEGRVRGYSVEPSDVYKATIKEDDVEEKVADLEKRIDGIQDTLDAHNATAKIEINVPEILQ